MPELFGMHAQIISEKETEANTREYSKNINEELPLMINVLFKLTYYVEPLDTERINFKNYCYDHYEQVPYTFSCLYNVFVAGYYNEVMILLRHLYEVLAKLRYFYKHEDKLQGYLEGKKICELDFFKLDSDDTFYRRDYSYLSRFAHGKDLFTVFRTEKPNHKKFILGNHFDKEYTDFFFMQIIALLYGYLNSFVLYFPQNDMHQEKEFHSRYMKTLKCIEELIKWHKENNPKSVDWYSSIEKFILR